LAHGWLTTSQGKMSKSKGNIIDPFQLLKKYPRDLLRAYLVAKINFYQDGVCSEDLLKEFYQDFLVNNLGNICSRVGKMLELYCDNIIPEFEKSENVKLSEYYQNCFSAVKEYQNLMDSYQLTKAFWEIQKLLDLSNKIIHELEP
jgi:methionyl-tRNA synthetase